MTINKLNSGDQKLPLDNQKLSQQQTQNSSAAKAEVQKSASSSVRQDSVSLTQSAQQLTQLQKKSAEAPVNQEKVDRLKKAIQNGEYTVNPETLARNISNLEAEIFGGKA